MQIRADDDLQIGVNEKVLIQHLLQKPNTLHRNSQFRNHNFPMAFLVVIPLSCPRKRGEEVLIHKVRQDSEKKHRHSFPKNLSQSCQGIQSVQ